MQKVWSFRMEEEIESKWEKKWLPDGQCYIYVHRITGEETEPIVAVCTCKCKTEPVEAIPFCHENNGIKEETCSMDEEDECGKDTSCSEMKEEKNESKWEKKWLPDGRRYIFVHRITGEETEPIAAVCTCKCNKTEPEEAISFVHESNGIYSMDEESYVEEEPRSKGLGKRRGKNNKKISHQSKSEAEAEVKTYTCKKCKKEVESLKKHYCGDNDFDYICCTCEKVFKTRYDMIEHLKSHGIKKERIEYYQRGRERIKNDCNNEVKPVKKYNCICLTCKKIFTSVEYALREHMQTHSGEKPYVCDLCGSAFSNASYLTKHSRIHSGKKPYECKICGKAFSTNSNYRHHLSCHLESRPYKCSQCDMAFKTNSHLNQHILYKHLPFSFTCEKCSKTFARQPDLKRHSIVHGEGVAASYECKECGKTFRWPDNLKMHLQTHEKHRTAFPCTICGRKLLCKKSLKRHVMIFHAD